MTGFVLCVLALVVAQGSASAVKYDAKIVDETFLQRQVDLLGLYFHIHEPLYEPELKTIADTWSLEKNIESFKNVTALKLYVELYEYKTQLPRSVPFNILEKTHQFEAVTLYNLLVSAKDYNTFFKTAVYLRGHVNEGLYVYVLSVAILNFPETKGVVIPPIYEVFPSLFFNGMIMSIAQKVNTQGKRIVEHDPHTTMWDDNVVIKWNTTVWPFAQNVDTPIFYLTHDYAFNTMYYNNHITYPFWLSEKDASITPQKRGKWFWYVHKQFVNIYYMERLSNGLGEISELDLSVVPEGYTSGLVYSSGIPFPVRPDNFNVDQPIFVEIIEKIQELEIRIRNAIDIGYVITPTGEKISLRTPEAIHILGNVIEGNVDSPNLDYYGSLVTVWKELLGNAIMSRYQYHNGYIPLVVPSPLELYQTSLRDPAFYMIWKRVLNLFTLCQSYLPPYTQEQLGFPAVTIEKVEVDKLVTYFERTYANITNELYMNEFERKIVADQVSVLVQHPQLNQKVFKTRIHVKSDVAKKVLVKFFLAPKYDSKGFEIPLEKNTENFVQIDEFVFDLPQGESVIKRDSTENKYRGEKWTSGVELYFQAFNALHGKGHFTVDPSEFGHFIQRFSLPKGRFGGMPFLFLVYISESHVPEHESHGPVGVDITTRHHLPEISIGYPLDRPLKPWVAKKLTNLVIEEVQVHHKPTPEIYVPYTMQ